MAQQSLMTIVDVAKGSVLAYNEKNWDKVRETVTPNVVYEEVATQRRAQGVNDVLTIWRGWAAALPDSKATFNKDYVSGNTVVLELTWNGTHTGALRSPNGDIAPTGKRITLRACQILEIAGEKVSSIRQYFDMATLLEQLGVMKG